VALQMTYTDSAGVAHTASYWRGTILVVGVQDHTLRLTFLVWRDKAAYTAGMDPMPGRKDYVLTGAEYDAWAAAAPSGASVKDVLMNAAELFAIGKKDVGTPAVSFFANATRIPN
jgi:hypothetical protein